ncbi:MAG TPA: His/Gly/Thr/Pro-type tRNA ligase C-terminal domain-containing protein, partial [Thermoanaerobaculia bacterium]
AGPVGVADVRVIADHAIQSMRDVVVGANKQDAHFVNANAGRDFVPSAYGDFILVGEGDPCPRCSTPLELFRGIEVGHIFKLGTKYSSAMHCTYLTEAGDRQPMIMGCYGLGVGRTVAAAIEQSHDKDGIIWPMPLAPFEAVVTAVGPDAEVQRVATEVYAKLQDAGIEVLFDDRDERPGVKFKDADLIGFPLRIVVGAKSLANGDVEWSFRKDRLKQLGKPEDVVARVVAEIVKLRPGI